MSEQKLNEAFAKAPNTMSYSKEALKALKEGGGKPVKKHYEFYGSLVSNLNLSRLIIVCQTLLLLGLVYFAFELSQKPPLVFRSDRDGKAVAYTPVNADSVFSEELVSKAKAFINNHNDLNPTSVAKSLELALAVTASKVREELLKEIKTEDLIATARKYRPTYNLEIGKVQITKRNHPYYTTFSIVNINFLRPKKFLRVHTYEITWKKFQRTETNPTGLFIVALNHYDQGNIKQNIR